MSLFFVFDLLFQFKIRVRHLKGSIEDSERLLTLRLAVMRNSLIKSELAATLLAAGLAVGTSISGTKP